MSCADHKVGYPALLPTDQILAEPVSQQQTGADPKALIDAQQARADALRDRAEALREPVIDTKTRDRMEQTNG